MSAKITLSEAVRQFGLHIGYAALHRQVVNAHRKNTDERLKEATCSIKRPDGRRSWFVDDQGKFAEWVAWLRDSESADDACGENGHH